MRNKIFHSLILTFLLLLISPSSAHALINSLNGQTGLRQTFSNDSNIHISSAGNVHSLGWTGVLPILRGGTGASSFTDGSIPIIENGVFSQNQKLKWENNSNVFELILGDDGGVSGNRSELILAQGSNLRLSNTDPIGTQEIVFQGRNGTSEPGELLFHMSYESSPLDGLFISNYSNGGGVGIDRVSGNVVIGKVGSLVGWPPKGTLQIQDSTDGFDHNSTLYLGGNDVDFPPQATTTGCLVMGDSDGDGVTYITANNGVLTASATKPSICQ